MEESVDSMGQLLEELDALRRQVAELREAEAARERALDALRESEVSYLALVDAIDDAVHVNDAEGRYAIVNSALARRLGREKEEILGKTPFDLYDASLAQRVMDQYHRVLRTGAAVDEEMEFPDGQRTRVSHMHRVPLRSRDGRVIGVVTVSRDATDRKLAEEALRKERDFASAVIDTVANLVVVLDREGRIVRINPACQRVTGYSLDEVRGKPGWELFLSAEEVESAKAVCESLITGRLHGNQENQWLVRDGSRRLIAWTSTAIVDSSGSVEYVVIAGSDITEQREAERALQESNERLIGWVSELEARSREDALLNEMGDLLQTCRTPEEAYSVIGRSASKLFPDMDGGLFIISASRNLVEVAATWGDASAAERVFAPEDCLALRRGRVHVVDSPPSGLICRHLNEPLPAAYLCIPMMAQGDVLGTLHLSASVDKTGGRGSASEHLASGREQLAVKVAEHIALSLANLRLQATLRDQAIHDLLTGLFNRRYMEEMLERELHRAARRHSSVGVMMLDIDHFKRFNDLFGHDAGDKLLAGLGGYLRTHTRGEDIVCRYGGEEITLILPDVPLETVVERAEELRQGIRLLTVEHRRQPLGPVTVSIGVAASPQHGGTAESLLHAADLALYRAKAEGRDRTVVAT